MKIVVWSSFGDLMHGERDVGGKHWNSGSGNREWWIERARLYHKYTLASLELQNRKPDLVVCGVANETSPEYTAPLAEVLKRSKLRTCIYRHGAKETLDRGQSPPASFLQSIKHMAPFSVVWLDSDDMLAYHALGEVDGHPTSPGMVLIMEQGYLLDTGTKKFHHYNPGVTSPPFFSRFYPPEAFADLDAYEKRWNYRQFHHHLHSSVEWDSLRSGLFCVVAHEKNTSTALTNAHVRDKLHGEVKPPERTFALRSFPQC